MVSILAGSGRPVADQRATIGGAKTATAAAATAGATATAATLAPVSQTLDDAKKALATMTGIASSMRQSRSDQAKQRLQQLLAQVKLLRLMGGDPKAVAKEAAQLAKEIGSAAKDFTAGAVGGIDVSAAAATATATATATDTAGQTGAAATADPGLTSEVSQAQALAQQAQQQAGQSAASASPASTSPASTSPASTAATAGTSTSPTGTTTSTATAGTAATSGVPASTPSPSPTAATGQAGNQATDDEQRLFRDVKAAVSGLRAIIERAAREARRGHDHHGAAQADDQAKVADQAAKDVEDAIKTIGEHGEGDTASSAASAVAPVMNLLV